MIKLMIFSSGMKLEDLNDNEFVSARTASKLIPTARTGKANKTGHSRPETVLLYIKQKKLKAKKISVGNQTVWAIKIGDIKKFVQTLD